jgi:hypothetical protein
MPEERMAHYIIGPRDPADSSQIEALRNCKEIIEKWPEAKVSEARNRLSACIPPSLAERLKREFENTLIVEPDVQLRDPRVMPDMGF